MSLLVKCTISINNDNKEVYAVASRTSSTGVFSGTHGEIIQYLIESASNMAVKEAIEKLQLIKGDIKDE